MDIETVASLARLTLSAEEKALYGSQLSRVLEHIQQLEKVDIAGVEPTAHAIPVFNVTRADEPTDGLAREEALRLAPRQAAGLFLVPKVIE